MPGNVCAVNGNINKWAALASFPACVMASSHRPWNLDWLPCEPFFALTGKWMLRLKLFIKNIFLDLLLIITVGNVEMWKSGSFLWFSCFFLADDQLAVLNCPLHGRKPSEYGIYCERYKDGLYYSGVSRKITRRLCKLKSVTVVSLIKYSFYQTRSLRTSFKVKILFITNLRP